jgi:hypothetical protein
MQFGKAVILSMLAVQEANHEGHGRVDHVTMRPLSQAGQIERTAIVPVDRALRCLEC